MTNNELRRAIAEALGYVVIPPSPDNAIGVGDYGIWEFRQRNEWRGCVLHQPGIDEITCEEDAWRAAWIPGPECGETVLPDWPGDLNTALGLVSSDIHFELENEPTGWHASFDNGAVTFESHDDHHARAICLAWLEWHGSQETD